MSGHWFDGLASRSVQIMFLSLSILGLVQGQEADELLGTVIQESSASEMDWIEGCGTDILELRGQIPVDRNQAKIERHIRICRTYCDPPSGGCDLLKTETSCDCLKCNMHCLKHGSYVADCIMEPQQTLCSRFHDQIGNETCDVDCNGARGKSVLWILALLSLLSLWV
ncbi:unnamed protein product [Polarella glacialis]|uniref:Uncharacterized protein n=1 Tax=Polarella glacialis TaxID=89957 RepID=A0A813JKH5_POLGL|nr:unnamed protein product [Polarella glacialis]CAE8679112.1 unnamed protein product [Polarella glacialis]|mmetsp:Transcript_66658/g.119974  ORF Transcript_66658/g.119974 Transcript_66658/m.119974 type:complete len:168 (-) Transcript_66658:129-632(-)